MTETATIPEIIIDSWPEQRIPEAELRASLLYLAYKTGKPVRLRKYAHEQRTTGRVVTLAVCTRDTCPNGHATPTLKLNGAEHHLSAPQPFFQADDLRGAPITDEQGAVLARVLHNCITILVEFTGEDNDTARAILAQVVDGAVALIECDAGPVQAQWEHAVSAQFESWLRTTVHSLLDDKKYELTRLEQDTERAYRQIVDNERRRPLLEEEVDRLSKLQRVPHPRLARTQSAQVLELLDRGLYEDITWNSSQGLVATTGAIVVDYANWRFPLGRYQVTIEPRGRLIIKDLTEHPKAEHPHPHVGSDGAPCLGNIHADIAKLIGRMRIAEALQVLHTFLSSYNREGAYESISRFDPTGEYVDEEEDWPAPRKVIQVL